jgi:hypothetical protein
MANGNGRAGTRSLQVVLGEVRVERDAQLRHFDALDAKAGIILGFAGAIVALAPSHHLVAGIGRLVAVISGLLSLWTFWPRRFELTNLYALREKYLGAEPEFTMLVLLDTQISMMATTRDTLDHKASRLKAAMTSLALAVVLVAAGIPLH